MVFNFLSFLLFSLSCFDILMLPPLCVIVPPPPVLSVCVCVCVCAFFSASAGLGLGLVSSLCCSIAAYHHTLSIITDRPY